MTTQHALQKLVRRLHRNLFNSLPNTGPREVDISRLKPMHVAFAVPEYSVEFDVQLNRQAAQTLETPLPAIPYADRDLATSSRFMPEPRDLKDQDR
jgi:hypothetical protein